METPTEKKITAQDILDANERTAQALRQAFDVMRDDIATTRQMIADLADLIQTAKPTPMSGGSGADDSANTWCEIHECDMQRHEKEGEVWFSHRAKRQDGSQYFCKGKKVRREPRDSHRLSTIGQTHAH